MTLFRKLLSRNRRPSPVSEIVTGAIAGGSSGADLSLYYSTIMENRPYVIAMREVATDSLYSLG